jgi:hypothetical protein
VDALAEAATRRPYETEATSLAEVTRPGFDRPTPGSGQTPLPRSGRATRPVTAATLTPPGAQAMPAVGRQTGAPGVEQPTAARPTPIPPAPLPGSAGTVFGAPGTMLGQPPAVPRKSSAPMIVGMTAVLAILAVAVVLLTPLRTTVTGLLGSAPATATVAPQAKPAAPPTAAPPTTAPAAAGAPAGGPTAAPAAQPKPPAPPTTAPPTTAPAAQPKPAAPPTAGPPPTLAPTARLAQARQASSAGNHTSALAILDELRKANPALPGLDDTQYDVHMAFARSLLEAGNLDGSYQQFEAALRVRPNDSAAQAGRNQIVLTKNYAIMEAAWDTDQEAAIKALEENMQLDPGFRETRPKLYALLIMKADRLIAAGERDAAFPVLMRALEVLPDAGEAQMRLATYTPVPTATPRPAVQPQQTTPQQKPSSGGSTYSPPAPAPAPAPAPSGGSACPGGVCP